MRSGGSSSSAFAEEVAADVGRQTGERIREAVVKRLIELPEHLLIIRDHSIIVDVDANQGERPAGPELVVKAAVDDA